jgi:hypothetical protein
LKSLDDDIDCRDEAATALPPLAGAEPFEPLHGDNPWRSATNFVELSGIKPLRQPRRAKASQTSPAVS